MPNPIRVLLLEDSASDAALIARELDRAKMGAVLERVETREAFRAALSGGPWDAILSDFTLVGFDAPAALEMVKARSLEVPFIIVSGTIGEEAAVAVLRAGASDFVSKDRLARLVPALERELRETALRVDRRKLRDHLLLCDRMSSIGVLAAGVAHEINNPLAAVLANLTFALEGVESLTKGRFDSRLDEMAVALREARDGAERVREIVGDLQLLATWDEEHRGPVDLHRALDTALRMAHGELRRRARVVKDYGEVPWVDAEEARLSHVFLNIVVNAVQALPEGDADAHEVRIVTRVTDDERVMVEIHDTGPGIPPELLPRVFEPFFTTKPMGVGSGLGLAICRRIVTGFGGEISAQSELGHGTVIRMLLPTKMHAPASASPVEPPSSRRARVLVVDDATVGAAMERILGADYEVTALTDANVALDRLRADGQEAFDVIFYSMTMPLVDGAHFHSELSRVDPEQVRRVIYMTDGAFSPSGRAFLDRVENPRMAKPLFAPALRDIVSILAGTT